MLLPNTMGRFYRRDGWTEIAVANKERDIPSAVAASCGRVQPCAQVVSNNGFRLAVQQPFGPSLLQRYAVGCGTTLRFERWVVSFSRHLR